MDTRDIAVRLVELCNAGRAEEAVTNLYSDGIVSIEGADSPELPARIEGIEAVRAKGDWWYANHEVHGMTTEGPFLGLAPDRFAVRFELDVTPKGGDRVQMTELGVYTVRDGRIVQEEFLYHA